MTTKVNGFSSAANTLAPDLQYYMCCASSPNAFTDPKPTPLPGDELARAINIQVTGNTRDQSQKNFEVLLMCISLRAMPVVLNNPVAVLDLSEYTSELTGQGFVWKFAVERGSQFQNFTPYGTPGPVGLLIDELDGLVLPSGVRVTTVVGSPSGWSQNIAFSRIEVI